MKVMFVDDEPQVLRGITRMLDDTDVDWEIETANSAKEALDLMANETADVVVSDMKMPGMDGADLLQVISDKYPGTVRIVLSGQANKQAVYRSISPMHQYLSKPCEADVLRETIRRSCALRELLEKTKSHELLAGVITLPSLPDLYERVIAEVESDHGTVANVGAIVEQDPAMTAKLLQLANSSIFGQQAQVTSSAQASSLIGMDVLKSLVLSSRVFESSGGVSKPCLSLEALSAHSLEVAGMARTIATSELLETEISNEAFTSGLLHDVGKLILMAYAGDRYSEALSLAKSDSISLLEAEHEVFGLGHDGIGGNLLALWGLPQSIVEGVAFHHRPHELTGSTLNTASVVCLANYFAHGQKESRSQSESEGIQDLICRLNLADRIEILAEQVLESETA